VLSAETLNLLGFHQSEILPGVPPYTEVPVADNAESSSDRDSLTLQLRRTSLGANEDPINNHRSLLRPNVGGNRRTRTGSAEGADALVRPR
jgi:hypothetical protein